MGISRGKTLKIQKDTCPKCGPKTKAEVISEHLIEEPIVEYPGAWWAEKFQILKCRGCECIYFRKAVTCSEWEETEYAPYTNKPIGRSFPEKIEYWPQHIQRKSPDWNKKLEAIDSDLFSILNEVYSANNDKLNVLTAIGIRTLFDRASEILKIDSNKTFAKKLEELAEQNLISSTEKSALEILIDAGSAAAHRGWRPKTSEIENMLSILESFLHRSFIVDSEAQSLQGSVPPRK